MTSSLISLSSLDDKYVKEKSITNSEPQWLMEIRNNAFSNYSSLPHEVSPLYKKYSDANLLYPDRVYLSQGTKTYEPEEYLSERIKELEKDTSILKNRFHYYSFQNFRKATRTRSCHFRS